MSTRLLFVPTVPAGPARRLAGDQALQQRDQLARRVEGRVRDGQLMQHHPRDIIAEQVHVAVRVMGADHPQPVRRPRAHPGAGRGDL